MNIACVEIIMYLNTHGVKAMEHAVDNYLILYHVETR